MRHFIFEFITGGGLTGQDLPESLLIEAELMLQSLISELRELNIELFVSRLVFLRRRKWMIVIGSR